jgi:hypothetical protein
MLGLLVFVCDGNPGRSHGSLASQHSLRKVEVAGNLLGSGGHTDGDTAWTVLRKLPAHTATRM